LPTRMPATSRIVLLRPATAVTGMRRPGRWNGASA
jgi:hypothetical protein